MFRKQDFKKLDLLGSGKKHTKIYKVEHITTGQIFALKEIEAKSLDKLNEYKEEAVQLSKVQNLSNIIKFYGYFFCETSYNTFRLGIVTEYMDNTLNLENLYRKRKKTGQYWTDKELVTFTFSLIATCSSLQQKGICHRDIKPANLFMLQNDEAKLIDFGESKDYFFDPNNENRPSYTMATIRGTPQYLSPILWRAHVIEGNSRYAQHNIYKSDVFSTGLVIAQLALLREVTGFNNKTETVDGEELIKQCLNEIEKIYGQDFASILALMLIFEEANRPSFVELEYFLLEFETRERENDMSTQSASTSHSRSKTKSNTNTSYDHPVTNAANELIKFYNKHYNTFNKKVLESFVTEPGATKKTMYGTERGSLNSSGLVHQLTKTERDGLNASYQSTQMNKQLTEVFLDDEKRAYDPKVYWFEYGGRSFARFDFIKNKWKFLGKLEDEEFPMHFSTIYATKRQSYYLIGGTGETNVREFSLQAMKFKRKPSMNKVRNFFASVYTPDNKIYVFGGYNDANKQQMLNCECYDIEAEKWKEIANLNIERSQAAACQMGNDKIYIVGGYNKKIGALKSIEQYFISTNKIVLINLALPEGLRRFSLKSFSNEMLIFGGIKQHFESNEIVYRIDAGNGVVEPWGNLSKGGVVDHETLVDSENTCHLFIEEANGTSPPYHIKYFYGEKLIIDP